MVYTYKRIIDSDGIEYKEVDYNTYLACKNRHRIVQHLESRYFIEEDKLKEDKQGCGKTICVKNGKSNHKSFCGCTYKGLHLCDDCKLKERKD